MKIFKSDIQLHNEWKCTIAEAEEFMQQEGVEDFFSAYQTADPAVRSIKRRIGIQLLDEYTAIIPEVRSAKEEAERIKKKEEIKARLQKEALEFDLLNCTRDSMAFIETLNNYNGFEKKKSITGFSIINLGNL